MRSLFNFLFERPFMQFFSRLNILGVFKTRLKIDVPRFWTRAGLAYMVEDLTAIKVQAGINHAVSGAPYGLAGAAGFHVLGIGTVVSAGVYQARGSLAQGGFTINVLGFGIDFELGLNTPVEFAAFWRRLLTPAQPMVYQYEIRPSMMSPNPMGPMHFTDLSEDSEPEGVRVVSVSKAAPKKHVKASTEKAIGKTARAARSSKGDK